MGYTYNDMCSQISILMSSTRPLPYSGRRYFVSSNGTLTNRYGEIISPCLIDGHQTVDIEWVFGKSTYLVATLVLVAFNKVALPDHLLSEVIPLYVDGDVTNLSVQNLIYKFRVQPLEVEEFPGFYYIPMYVNYGISRDGDLINVKTGKNKIWSITKPVPERNALGGYHYSRVLNDEGFSLTLFRHRAMALTFLDYSENCVNLVINHKDGIPGNDRIANLEWCSYLENNIHAVQNGLRNDNLPVLSKHLKTGEVLKFASLNECAKHYGHPQGNYIRGRMLSNKIYSDYLIFKRDDGSDWPDVDLAKVKIHIAKSSNVILARNVFAGNILVFSGAPAGVDATGVKEATILSHAKNELLIPIKGWNFRYAHDGDVQWPKHSRRHLIVYEKYPIYPPDGLIVKSVKTEEELFYPSIAEAANAMRLGMNGIRYLIKVGNLYKDEWKLEVFDLRKNLSLPTE